VRKYYHEIEGYNGRLDAIQAGVLRVKLRHLDSWNRRRREAAAHYNALLESAAIPGLVTPYEPESSRGVYHLYVVKTPKRAELSNQLGAQGIGTGLHYPVPVHLQRCYAEWGYVPGSLPITEQAAGEILSLPMFPHITPVQQERVIQEVGAFVRAGVPA
jgi:dTDP-4-amino-4,6-dideoxygalactose transaminase